MRVLHVHPGNIFGGIEATLLTQARQRKLAPGLEPSFALCFDGRFCEELSATGATVHSLGQVRVREPLSVRRARQNLKALLRQEPFDVVVTHSCWSQAIFGAAVRAASLPLVFYMHGPAGGKHWLERWARRTLPDLVLCNSQFTATSVAQLYPQVDAEVIYCPVAPADTTYSAADRKLLRAELQTPPDATVIVQVSRLEPWKGHLVHLEALSLLRDLPGWVCWQVGGAQQPNEIEYLAELKRRAAELGIAERVRFLDQRPDVERLLAAADIFCQPNTDGEPFGIVFVEALNAELPVITTDIGGAREIVDDSCGVLVPAGDAPALAESLRQLIQDQDERSRLGMAGPARARRLCDPAQQLAQFRGALEALTQAPLLVSMATQSQNPDYSG